MVKVKPGSPSMGRSLAESPAAWPNYVLRAGQACARVLIVTADQELADLLAGILEAEGLETVSTHGAQDALPFVHETRPDVILIDKPAGRWEGLDLCRRLRADTDAAIVLIAPDASEAEIVRALEAGADEYLARPLRPRELAARLRALLRRTNSLRAGATNGRLAMGDLQVNLEERRVYKRGQLVELSPIEFRLFTCLLREPGRVLNHRKLMAQVWGPEYVDCRHYLRLYIRYLRSKLEDDPRDPKVILSEWGVGYRFQPPDSPEP